MKIHISLAAIWFVFFLLFLILGKIHFNNRNNTIPQMDFNVVGRINGVSTGMAEMREAVNAYIDDYNNSTRKQNLFAAAGYGLAALTALFSMGMEIKAVLNIFKNTAV